MVITKRCLRSCSTSSTVQFDTDGVPGTGVLGDKVVPATELLPLRENSVTTGVDRPSSSILPSSLTSLYTMLKIKNNYYKKKHNYKL